MSTRPPPQAVGRAVLIATALSLLLVLHVQGTAAYAAWFVVGRAVAGEAAATVVYVVRSRRRDRGGRGR